MSKRVKIYWPGAKVPSHPGIPPPRGMGFFVAGGGHIEGPFDTWERALMERDRLQRAVKADTENAVEG